MTAPTLAIITVNYNDAAGLSRTLASIGSQIVEPVVEHIVVDGGSNDGSIAVFDAVSLPFSRIVSEPDDGVYDAMNKGIAMANSDYIMFLNSGDWLYDENSLQTLADALQSRPTWLVARAVHHHGGTQPPTVIANLPHRWWRHALGMQPHCHQSTVFARKLLETLGGHAEEFDFAGDFDLILRAGLVVAPKELDVVVANYAGGGMSAARGRDIPKLLARVREDRLQLRGWTARVNSAFASYREMRFVIHQTRRRYR